MADVTRRDRTRDWWRSRQTRRGFMRWAATGLSAATRGRPGSRAAGTPSAPGPTRVQLTVAPNPAPVDAPVSIRLTGLMPGQVATLSAEDVDDAGVTWVGEATFEADTRGAIDPATQEPRQGTYGGTDPMGLVWSAVPLGASSGSRFYSPALRPRPLAITAAVEATVVAHADLIRQVLAPAVTSTDLDDRGLYGRLFRAEGDEPVPAVVVLGGSGGGLDPYALRDAALLASHGFAALALAYFGVAALPIKLSNIPLEYFADAIAWLQAHPGVRGDRLAVVGHSRGGELALLLGATYSQIRAVVSYVGSGIVFSSPDGSTPAWTHRGEALPYATSFADAASWDQAVIPVERIDGPVLLLSAEDDRVWPSAELSEIAMDRLRRAGRSFADEHRRYPGAGHAVLPPYLPTTAGLDFFGGTPEDTAAACADSWPRVLALLDARLRH